MNQRQLKEEYELLKNNIKQREELIEKITNNPDYVLDIYEEYPWFFSVLYLYYRKYEFATTITSQIHIYDTFNCDFDDDKNNINESIYHYYLHLDDNYELMPTIFKLLSTEVSNLAYNLNISFLEPESDMYNEYSSKEVIVILDDIFNLYLVMPIIEGKYNDELEKICKRNLLNLTLKEEIVYD